MLSGKGPATHDMSTDEPEPFEVLGAPPVVSLSSISHALSPAVGASLSRHPDARAGFIGMHILAHIEGRRPPDAPPLGHQPESSDLRALEGMLRPREAGAVRALLRVC